MPHLLPRAPLDPAGPDRYARQRVLAGLGSAGQARIRAGKVIVFGLGGLGAPAAAYLAGAGVAALTLVDPDVVEATNLHRQVLYTNDDVGLPKAGALSRRLRQLNSDVAFRPVAEAATPSNLAALLAGHQIAIDGMDDHDAKLALAEACRTAGIPLAYGAAAGWEGMASLFHPPSTPCLWCAFPNPQPGATCADAGVLGPMVGIVGLTLAQEVIKELAGMGSSLRGKLLLWDGHDAASRTIALKRRDGCRCTVQEDGPACPMPWNAPNVAAALTVAELEPRMNDVLLLDVREPDEHEEFALPGSKLIPLGQLQARVGELPKGRPIVVYCAVGGRSARATDFLRRQGYDAANLTGGIRAWLMRKR